MYKNRKAGGRERERKREREREGELVDEEGGWDWIFIEIRASHDVSTDTLQVVEVAWRNSRRRIRQQATLNAEQVSVSSGHVIVTESVL